FRLVPDDTRIDFMRGRFIGLLVSAVLSTASVVLFFYPGLSLGIDFSGGIIMEVRTPGPADFGKIRAALAGEHVGEQGVQRFGAVATLILDATKTIGFLAITRIEFDLVMVAAILTVIGYSTNDKVVVYDRVRENLRKYKTMPLRQLIDLSINETLNRTLGTSMTVFLASLPLALFGNESISG